MSPTLSLAQVSLAPDVLVILALLVVPVAFLFAAYKLMQGLLAYEQRRRNGA